MFDKLQALLRKLKFNEFQFIILNNAVGIYQFKIFRHGLHGFTQIKEKLNKIPPAPL